MLDIGFRPDIERILRKLPTPRQTLLLSATINPDVRKLAQRYMYQPIEVNLSQDEISVETIQQFYVSVSTERKLELLLLLLKRDRPRQCIVFTRTRRGADRLADRLHRVMNGVSAIHGDLPQSTRDRVMKGFRSGQISVLVATDVVGRGIDVEGISHVINYDMPDDPENYVHRIGRTGRMGKDGVAYLFVCPDQGEPLTAIENLVNRVIPPLEIPGFSQARKRVEPVARELFNNSVSRSVSSMATH
jgi:ATP-dependent RNA helicase DeaD